MFLGRMMLGRKSYLKYKIIAVFVLFCTILITGFMYFDREIAPTVQAIGELKAQEIITRSINESIRVVLKEGLDYQDLISVREDEEGNITMMQANTFLMNKVASDVALTVQDYLKEIMTTPDRIPIGNALGSQILAQYGPKVKLKLSPRGVVDVNFGTEFEQAGINQTRHRIYLIINTSVRVIVPFSSNNVNVTTYFPVAETIIVGKVPMNYVNVPEDSIMDSITTYEE